MKKKVALLFAIIWSFSFSASSLYAQDFKKEFEWFDLKIENGEAFIHPKKNLFWSSKTQEERKLNSYFMSRLGCRDVDSFEVDQNGNITHYIKISKTGSYDSSIIASSENTEQFSFTDWNRAFKSENELLHRSSQLYIKKFGEFLIVSIPSQCSSVSKYKYTENYDNDLYSKINWETAEDSYHLSGYLLVYNFKTKKAVLDLAGHSLYNLNADGITYSNYHSEDSKKLYSMMNWNGNYLFKNINLQQLSDNDSYLKSMVGNCKAIYDKYIQFPFYPAGIFVNYGFRYISQDGKCGFFNFIGQHEKYDVEFTDGTPLFYSQNRLNYFGKNVSFYKEGMIIHPADTSFESIYNDAVLSWVDDTIIKPADTVNGEFQNMDTLLKATHCLAYLPDLERRGYNSIIQEHFTINGEKEKIPSGNYLASYNFIWKRGNSVFSNSASIYHVEPFKYVVKPDPNDPITWYDSINPWTGELVYDTALISHSGIINIDERLTIYDINKKNIIEKKGQSISAINEDGLLMQEVNYPSDINSALSYLYNGTNSVKSTKFWTIDTTTFNNRKSFWAKDIIAKPNEFLKSFLGSGNFALNYIHHSNFDWSADTLFTIEYNYKNKRRVISNSQAIIEIAKTKKIIPIGGNMCSLELSLKEKLEKISKESKYAEEIKFQYTEGNFYESTNNACIFHKNSLIFTNPGKTESIYKVIKPDPYDPNTWYDEIDENGNFVAADFLVYPGYLTLTNRNLDVIYANDKCGITAFNENLFLLQDIEISHDYDRASCRNNFSIMEVNEGTAFPTINNITALEGFIGRNNLESIFFPGNHSVNNEGRITKMNQLIEISKNNQIIDGVYIEKPLQIEGKLKGSILPAKKNGKYGLIRMDGQIITPFKFENLELIEYDLKNYLLFSSKSLTEIYDIHGNLVTKYNDFKYFIKETETINEFGKTSSLFVRTPQGNYLYENFVGKNKIKLPDDFFTYKLDSINEDGYLVHTLTNGIYQEKFYNVQKVTKTKKGWFIHGKYYDEPLYDYLSVEGNRIGSVTEFRFTGQPDQKNKLVSDEFIIVKKWYNIDYGFMEDVWYLYDKNGTLLTEGSYTDIQEIGDSLLLLKNFDQVTLLNPYTGKKTENPVYTGYSFPIELILDSETGLLKDVFCFMDALSGKIGIMDKYLNVLVSPTFSDGMLLDNQRFWMKNSDGAKLLDKKGAPVFQGNNNAYRIYDYGVGKYRTDQIFINSEKNTTLYDSDMKKLMVCDPVINYYLDSEIGFFILKTKDSILLLEPDGKLIFRRNYKSLNRFKDGYAVYTSADGKSEGVVDKNGVEVIPAISGRAIMETYYRSSLEPIVNNGTFIYKDNDHFGLINSSNKEITGPDFEKLDAIENNYFIASIGKDKLGVLDSKGNYILPLDNRSIGYPDSLGNRILSKRIDATENGRKKSIEINALLDKNMNFLLAFDNKPEIQAYSNKCHCYPVILQNENNTKAAFYFPDSKLLENDLSKYPDQNFVKEFSQDLKIDYAPEWNRIPGINSSAVTCFHEDANGNWWIGAGPRQGVYLSEDEGKNWVKVNDGLNDVHVSLIGSFEGRIFAEEHMKKIHLLDSDNKWKPVADSIARIIRDTLATKAARNQSQLDTAFQLSWQKFELYDYPNMLQDYELYHTMLNSYVFSEYLGINYYDHFYGYDYSGSFYLLDTSASREENRFAQNLSPMFLYRSGNFFKTKKSKLLMINDEGLFEIDNSGKKKNKLSPDFTGGSVKAIVKKDDKTIYLLTSDEKIWKMNGNQWILFYDAKKDVNLKKVNDMQNISRISNIQVTSNNLIFTRNGSVYQLDKNGKTSELVTSSATDKDGISREKQILSGIKKGEAIYGVAQLLDYPISECIYKFENKIFTILYEYSSSRENIQLLSDPNQNLWIFDREQLIRLKNDSTGCDTVELYSNHDLTFLKNEKGKFQLVDEFNLHTYDPKTKKWQKERLYNVYESGNTPIHAFTLDKSGNGFMATGNPYVIHYREDKAFYYKIGLSKIYFNGSEYDIKPFENAPNNWITSLTPWRDGLLAGTIGSGVYYIEYKR